MTDPIGTALIERLLKRVDYWNAMQHEPDADLCRQAADALESRIAEVGRLREAVEHAEHVFRCYADLHERKGTADGRAKARRNIEHAERMSAALSLPKESVSLAVRLVANYSLTRSD